MSQAKTVVLVGATNVGKSTLFNRLSRSRRAIVCDRAGVTIDRQEMIVQSPAGEIRLVDTGGVGSRVLAVELGEEVVEAARVAVSQADLILFVVDGISGLNHDTEECAAWLRQHSNKNSAPVWVLINKTDRKDFDGTEFYSLGFDEYFPLSAEHGRGVDPLWEAMSEYLGQSDSTNLREWVSPKTKNNDEGRIIVLGRPNVGKSTLLNSILQEERHVVSKVAGTTRDVIQSQTKIKGRSWQLFDSAGMRRPGRRERDVEWVATEKLKDAAKNCDVALVVIDSDEGVSDLDAAIAGMAVDMGLSVILVFNKWDRIEASEEGQDKLQTLERSRDLKLSFLSWAPQIRISALTGKGMKDIFEEVETVLKARQTRVQTSALNQLFEAKIKQHPHPIGPHGRVAKFYYITQVRSDPPEFTLFGNIPEKAVHFSYKRFLNNSIRGEFNFKGTPIKIHFRAKRA